MNVRKQLEEKISKALAVAGAPAGSPALVAVSSKPEFGDYQANGVMAAAKSMRMNPRQLAGKVLAEFQKGGAGDLSALAEKVEVAGPGFLNITLRNEWLSGQLAGIQQDDLLGADVSPEPQTVVVDYSAPNLAKEMHVGHLRSTIIGDCLSRVLEFVGQTVVRQNHVGDWGTQFGMLVQYMMEKSGYTFDEKMTGGPATFISDLEDFYRQAKLLYDRDAGFAARARGRVVKLQGGDPDTLGAWRWFLTVSMKHCQDVYDRLGVKLADGDVRGESAYNDDLPTVITDLDKAGLLSETKLAQVEFVKESVQHTTQVVVQKSPEGLLQISVGMPALSHSVVFAGIHGVDLAKCVFLSEFVGKDGSPLPFIVQKSDEGYLYATTDLAAIRYRVSVLHADRVLYVVDARQSLHFKMLFAVARKAGFAPENVSLEHVAFGTMMGPDGKPFKTRTGGTVKLMDLLNEAVDKAMELVTRKNADDVAKGRAEPLPDEQKQQIAGAVGIGAVKYADLSQNRNSDYVFSFDKMLSLDGNTAPYMQYAYARIRSIYRKGGLDDSHASGAITVVEGPERTLAVRLMQFPEAVATVACECLPNVLCAYLYDLAGAFTGFYENCPVLKSDEPVRTSRLALCALTARVIRKGLELLGIQTIEQM